MDNDVQKTLDQFLLYESEHKLFEMKMNGVAYWHYIRFFIYTQILEIKYGIENRNLKQKQASQEDSLLDKLNKSIIKNPMLVRHKDILIFNHPRRVKQKDYYKCIYTDEWLKECNNSYYVFEEPFNGIHLEPVKTKNLKYFDMAKYSKHIKPKSMQSTKINLFQLLQDFEKEFDIQFSNKQRGYISNIVKDQMENREQCKLCYQNLLKRINPKVILMVVAYNLQHMLLIETAKEMGIPTVELEHGFIGKGHIAYNFHEKVYLPSFPDYIFTFGQYDVDVPRYPFDIKHAISVGSSELESQVQYYKGKIRKRSKKIITYLSDATVDLLKDAIELSKIINLKEYKIVVKLHPSEYKEWRTWYPFLMNPNILVVDDSKHNIYYYLAISDYVIGCASTTVYEATAFHTNILVFKAGQYFKSEALVENKYANYVSCAEDIKVLLSKNNESENKVNKDYFFQKDSKKRINEAINAIIDGRYK